MLAGKNRHAPSPSPSPTPHPPPHNHCPYYIDRFETKFHYYNYHPWTVSHCDCDQQLYQCLKVRIGTPPPPPPQDHCPYYIDRFETKFHYYNYHPWTVSHCDCDQHLYQCLKLRIGTPPSPSPPPSPQDHCPYYIARFETKFHYYNYHSWTVSHCDCDLYQCLKVRIGPPPLPFPLPRTIVPTT